MEDKAAVFFFVAQLDLDFEQEAPHLETYTTHTRWAPTSLKLGYNPYK